MALLASRHGVDPDDNDAVNAWFDTVAGACTPEQSLEILEAIADIVDSLCDDDVTFTSPEKPRGTPVPAPDD